MTLEELYNFDYIFLIFIFTKFFLFVLFLINYHHGTMHYSKGHIPHCESFDSYILLFKTYIMSILKTSKLHIN